MLIYHRVNRLMFDLVTKPEEFSTSIKRTTASIASITLFGHRAPDFDSFWAYVSLQAHSSWNIADFTSTGCLHCDGSGKNIPICQYFALRRVELMFFPWQGSKAVAPGTYLPVDQFPILKLLPDRFIMGRQRAKDLYATMTGVWNDARERVDKRRSAGDKRESLMDRFLDEDIKSDVPLSYSGLNNLLGGVHMAAADTTAIAMLTNILFLAKHPEFQDKARVELDRVCGTDRMPRWSDFNDLPYVNCIVKEGLRIRPM